ncbi:hypothetical protein ARMSODRAFT_1011772 [Armillaria solidipes]|uniref:F-box domain-containing protein n=1 Tax=Armillaria solidipes TaxID=1076256 RepID=A0A2H3C3Q0_9AGAR|nr:hypothetical protein ARMSODRAFT_1011772 [Armillaria solidipes]
MHRALTIPELIHEIFSHVSTRDLASSVSVVCKQWSDISTEIIWRKLDDLRPLLRLIGEIEVNPYIERGRGRFSCKFTSLYEDWSRFDFYSRHVRVFSLNGSSIDYQPALSDIAMLRSGMAFLPRLKELEWYGCEGDSWKSSVFMMHEGITTFTLSVPWGLSNEGYTHTAQCFGFIAARMSRLEYLHIASIRYRDPHISLLGSALEPVVSKLTSLKSITFPPFTNTFSIIAEMSTLPHITTIVVEDRSYSAHIPSFPPGLSCSLPSRLGTLRAFTTFGDATRLFNTDLPHLSDILLESGQSEAPSTVHRLARLISHCCRNIRELQLTSPETPQEFTGSFDCITIADIAPLFSCSAMEVLIIEHAFPLLLPDSDIRTLLIRWPALKVLNLNSTPLSFTREVSNLPLPEWKTLATFARYGTNLVELGLYMNGLVDVPDNKDAYPFAQLASLIVGASEIRGSHDEARLLSYILPSGCTITADSSDEWEQIIPLIPVLWQVQAEEREAKKELERRVVELEAQLTSARN